MIKDSKQIKAVLFDIDDTLYTNFMMLLSTPFRYMRVIKWIYHYYCMRRKLRNILQDTVVTAQQFEQLSIDLFSQRTGLSKHDVQYILRNKIEKQWIEGLKKTTLRKGIRKLLGDLYRKNYKLGVVSDFLAYDKLKNWNIASYFTSIISSEQYGCLKPNHLLFDTVARQLGVKNEECLYIGNHIKYDGFGALQANMKTLIFASSFSKIMGKKYPAQIPIIYSVDDIYGYLNM